jgi:hypothetical protein
MIGFLLRETHRTTMRENRTQLRMTAVTEMAFPVREGLL